MRQPIKPAHPGCGEWSSYQKSKAEQEGKYIEIKFRRIFQYQQVEHKPRHKCQYMDIGTGGQDQYSNESLLTPINKWIS
jgi:hypothetical protein